MAFADKYTCSRCGLSHSYPLPLDMKWSPCCEHCLKEPVGSCKPKIYKPDTCSDCGVYPHYRMEIQAGGLTFCDTCLSKRNNSKKDFPAQENQSPSDNRADLLPPSALLRVTEILKKGVEVYGVDNWKKINPRLHVGRALVHMLKWMEGKDCSEDHLSHAATRLLFALDLQLDGEPE